MATATSADPRLPVSPLIDRAVGWGQEPDISARAAIVTILGDTVLPLGGTVWLADLISLARPFGFSERLVRTSVFRLVTEDWVTSERVGRRSRYSLTDRGRRETQAAQSRIYRRGERPWDGAWTLVFLNGYGTATDNGTGRHTHAATAEDPTQVLRWRGFARMGPGLFARPNDHTAETRDLLADLAIEPPPPVATARFDDHGETPVTGSPFRADSGLAEAEAAYLRFIDRHRDALDDRPPADLEPAEAFAVRTMVVHDLRRARLQDPDLPMALLPDDWAGFRATELAADLYRSVTDRAWEWVAEVTGLTLEPDHPALTERFATDPTDARSEA